MINYAPGLFVIDSISLQRGGKGTSFKQVLPGSLADIVKLPVAQRNISATKMLAAYGERDLFVCQGTSYQPVTIP